MVKLPRYRKLTGNVNSTSLFVLQLLLWKNPLLKDNCGSSQLGSHFSSFFSINAISTIIFTNLTGESWEHRDITKNMHGGSKNMSTQTQSKQCNNLRRSFPEDRVAVVNIHHESEADFLIQF